MLNLTNIEYNLAYSCAPCLAGIKPSNLMSISLEDFKHIVLNDKNLLESKGFYLKVLCTCENRIQLLLYKKDMLEALIKNPKFIQAILMFGYSTKMKLETMLDILASKMQISRLNQNCKRECSFPHEIGLFLGYPIYDVLQYSKKKGVGCIFSGYWKVYSNAEKAAETFEKYNECKKHFALQIEKGLSLCDLLSA